MGFGCPLSKTRNRRENSIPVPKDANSSKPAFVALSRFVVANGMEKEVRQAFHQRPHLVDDVAGFIRMEVLSPANAPAEFWLMTYWADESDFQRWHRSHAYHDSHSGIPKGLKLIPGETRISHFNHICS